MASKSIFALVRRFAASAVLYSVLCVVAGAGNAQTSPLTVQITSPISTSDFRSPWTTVSGTFNGPDGTVVTINGDRACLYGHNFYYNDLELQSPQTTIVATAVSPTGESVSTTTKVVLPRSPEGILVRGDKCGEPPPFKATYSVERTQGLQTFGTTGIQADFYGSGQLTGVSEVISKVTNSYEGPGAYRAHFLITLANGRRYDSYRYAVVSAKEDSTADIKILIRNFMTSVGNNDRQAAYGYLTEGMQQRRGQLLLSSPTAISNLLAIYSGNPSPVAVHDDIAEFNFDGLANGLTAKMNFMRDRNGAWKIDAVAIH